jgi:hypothetical protein
MEARVTVLRGELPGWAARRGYGDGFGSGYGYGSGYGDGSGSGYGDGSGDGYGDGDGYGSGSGDGSGYGYGYGYGSGSGYGDGSGDGYGYGSGSGYGDGSGDGSGSGSGEDIHRCSPYDVRVTDERLLGAGAEASCEQLQQFRRTFPDGAVWPRDMERAAEAGLQVGWAVEALGLLWPTVDGA